MRKTFERVLGVAALALATVLAGCARAPLEMTQTSAIVSQVQREVAADSQAASHPIDLYEAIARTLIYNQELKAEQMARMLASAQASLGAMDMLPQFVASSQVYARSNVAASASSSLAFPNRMSGYSFSSGQVSRSRELAFSWSILDFGVSYFRARQAGHRANIAAEQQRRTANSLIEETRIAFWRALALQTLDEGLRRLDAEMALSIANAGRLSAAGLTDPMEALAGERDLLSIRRELDQQRKILVGADEQLRALMNYPPSAPLILAQTPQTPPPAMARLSFATLADAALNSRPEMRQAIYEQKITAEEARIAFLELFPNLNIILGDSLEKNRFLLNQGWLSAATRVSWQLVKVLQYPAKSSVMDKQAELDRQRTRALAVAIMLQAQVSLSRLEQSQNEYRTLTQLARVQRQLAQQVDNMRRVGRLGGQAATKERMNALLAEARRDAAFGEVQGAYASVLTSFGQDVADSTQTQGQSPEALAAHLREVETSLFARAGAARLASRS